VRSRDGELLAILEGTILNQFGIYASVARIVDVLWRRLV
jgi:hypothetical protein